MQCSAILKSEAQRKVALFPLPPSPLGQNSSWRLLLDFFLPALSETIVYSFIVYTIHSGIFYCVHGRADSGYLDMRVDTLKPKKTKKGDVYMPAEFVYWESGTARTLCRC